MKYKVSITGKDGDSYEEVIGAADRFQIYRDIKERGDRVLDISEQSGMSFLSLSFINEALNSVSLDEKVVLTRNLGAMLDAGLTTSRALSVMERQTKNPRLKSILASM